MLLGNSDSIMYHVMVSLYTLVRTITDLYFYFPNSPGGWVGHQRIGGSEGPTINEM